MDARFTEFCNKEVINVTDGMKIGYADDVVFDTTSASVSALVVFGRLRFFGLFGRGEDMIIDWKDIEVIGEDTILIKNEGIFKERDRTQSRAHRQKHSPKPNFFEKLFFNTF